MPVDHLYASPVLVDYFKHRKLGNLTVVSPDAGGVERARAFAKKLDAPLAIVDKRRVDVDVSEVMHLIGDVRGMPALIVDDIIDTAGTLVKTVEALLKEGATEVFAACTHAVLSGPAVERICRSPISEVVVTDSVPLCAAAQGVAKIKVLSVAELFARGIRNDSRGNFDQRAIQLGVSRWGSRERRAKRTGRMPVLAMRLRRMVESRSGDRRARGPDGRKERRQECLRYQMRSRRMLDSQSGDRRDRGLVVHEFHWRCARACECYGEC